jgi:hypothetical protein
MGSISISLHMLSCYKKLHDLKVNSREWLFFVVFGKINKKNKKNKKTFQEKNIKCWKSLVSKAYLV